MKNIQKLFVIALLYLFQINSSFAIECYYCNSLTHPKECGKKFMPEHGRENELLIDCANINPHTRISSSDNQGQTDLQSVLTRANFAGTADLSNPKDKDLCFTTILQTHDGKQEVYVRDCGLLENEKQQCAHITEEATHAKLKVKSCKACTKGYCNSANTNINISFVMFISVLFYYLL